MLLLACGGRVDPGSKSSGENAPTKTPPSTSSASSPGVDNPDADTDLGPCTLGPMEYAEPDKPCAWVVDNRCYDARNGVQLRLSPYAQQPVCQRFRRGPERPRLGGLQLKLAPDPSAAAA